MPVIFELQQTLCNNYNDVGDEFYKELAGDKLRILDIGCSTGKAASVFIDMVKHEYIGVDLDVKYTNYAAQARPNGTFLPINARALPFDASHFDRILFLGTLHHMDNDTARACFAEARRVLKPGGFVLVAEPVFSKGMWLSTALLKMDRGDYIRKAEEYRALAEGFEVEREKLFRFSAHNFKSLVLKSTEVNV